MAIVPRVINYSRRNAGGLGGWITTLSLVEVITLVTTGHSLSTIIHPQQVKKASSSSRFSWYYLLAIAEYFYPTFFFTIVIVKYYLNEKDHFESCFITN